MDLKYKILNGLMITGAILSLIVVLWRVPILEQPTTIGMVDSLEVALSNIEECGKNIESVSANYDTIGMILDSIIDGFHTFDDMFQLPNIPTVTPQYHDTLPVYKIVRVFDSFPNKGGLLLELRLIDQVIQSDDRYTFFQFYNQFAIYKLKEEYYDISK